MYKGNIWVEALASKYEAEIKVAKATLQVYFKNSVGIGEHSDLVEEFDKHIEALASAEEKLETLRRNFT
ncbi:hypothetical protein N8464_00085 [bacterium]|jgi:hypothetical protein|nr:hypothetical protein [bacterium]|tara:strand:+ start:1296 stop:1502 length:207 start_codon:yes stop_codon:yes gene_type:complete